ncbi:MAG TPA: hypothetical protein VE985_04460, partial [Gaiellaceae bacterium]|nr:hypothetical protein [Gaiellaceae bacterium]
MPRRDCSARHGRSPADNGPGGDHHAARRVAEEQEHLAGEGAAEATARLDRCAHYDELRAALGRHSRDLLAEALRPR